MAVDTPLLNGNAAESEKKSFSVREFGGESKKLWHLAGPAIFTALSQYSLGALTQTFAGLVGELELAAVSVENSVIAGLAFGVMVRLLPSAYLVLRSRRVFLVLGGCSVECGKRGHVLVNGSTLSD
ncbi:hypothetical protein MLD38_000737 [Melastoma candidum]|uniref:Uncharacterized protein n=1 Tax=Melastoma candidum TaxID=119954 RepID=A0ACB9SB53_9MYRT|nr:hypothetical protein MLD38_000737 [Melastoma candidum]